MCSSQAVTHQQSGRTHFSAYQFRATVRRSGRETQWKCTQNACISSQKEARIKSGANPMRPRKPGQGRRKIPERASDAVCIARRTWAAERKRRTSVQLCGPSFMCRFSLEFTPTGRAGAANHALTESGLSTSRKDRSPANRKIKNLAHNRFDH
jgi:hypothetical protein